MSSSLEKLDAWLVSNRPDFLTQLNPGVTPERIDLLEKTLKIAVPEDFRSYLRWHDGQSPEADTFYENRRLMSLAEITRSAEVFQDCRASGEFPNDDWWRPTWIPFVADGGGNHLVLDCGSGAVLEFWKSDADRPQVAPSFSDWIEELVQMFSREDWVLERGAFVRKSTATAANPYEKVSVVLLRAPAGGLAGLKSIYDRLALSYGIGKLLSDVKRGPVTLFSGICYMEACRLMKAIGDTSCLEIQSDENPETTYPIQ